MTEAMLVWRGSLKPTLREFSEANRLGLTRIVVEPDDSIVESRWQFIRGQWREVRRWRKDPLNTGQDPGQAASDTVAEVLLR